MANKRLVVIDGKSVFYRGYYAMPNLATKDGRPTGGVYGFAMMALDVLKKYQPDYVCVAWDIAKTSIGRRTNIYPQYKANRKPPPADFKEQIPTLQELLKTLSWPFYEIDDHEADDIMATFAKQAEDKGYETILISSDKDLLQLVSDKTSVATLKKGLTNVELFDPAHFREVFNMTPLQFIDYKALRGDPSDNLPGVAGVGEKTAIQLIADHGSLDGVYKDLADIKPAVKAKLEKDKVAAYITKQLVILDKEVPLTLDWKQAEVNRLDPKALHDKLIELEFRNLARQLPELYKYDTEGVVEASADLTLPKVENVTSASKLPKLKESEIYIQSYSRARHGKELHKLFVMQDGKGYSIDVEKVGNKLVANWLNEPKKLLIVAHDAKHVIKALHWIGVDGVVVVHDVQVAAFLLNALLRDQTLTALARDGLGFEGQDLDDIDPIAMLDVAPIVLGVVNALHKQQLADLKDIPSVAKLANEIEWPCIPVLAKMELEGIALDVDYLAKMSVRLEDRISDVTQQIYGHADKEFNISSPSQLAEVLFDGLELSTHGVKKGKTGFSTAARELDKLRDFHPIINLITTYRELTKLKSTYVDSLPKLIDEDGRLRTTFSLTTAQTGRLSSHDPNLQNIPVRTELGREIRSAFSAGDGNIFISADYSQFELRLAAELAGDDELIESFNDGLDIHTRTAAQSYGVALEDVTKDQRRNAKVINFGILYGMSPHGLSQATDMSPTEAKEFIDRYFDLRKPILDYIDSTKELAKTQGYVETLFGRRRPTPDAHSSNFVVREAALRAAFNMPIQGTEADIMKLAMVEVDKHLDGDCKQLLQIHDSILIECPESKAEKVGKLVKTIMENIYKLKVNLDVDISTGKTWGDI